MTRPTRLDASSRSVVVWCTDCPSWRRVTNNRGEALRENARHLDLVHGATAQAEKQREQATRIAARHAEP